MKVTINGQNYTAGLDAVRPLTIERKLNEPSQCQLWLSIAADNSLATPQRYQHLGITGDDGTIYFTGYIALSPLLEYVGLAMEGARYRIAIQALSDEMLLDQKPMRSGGSVAGATAGELMASLVSRSGATELSTSGVTLDTPVSYFAPGPGASWSWSAGEVASQARGVYRALNGVLTVAAVPGAVHELEESSGSLNLANLALTGSVKRSLANDVTVCGEHEPVAYVTEYFRGDGSTTEFYLAAEPFFPSSSAAAIIRESFNEAAIDERVWGNSDGSGYLSLGSGGLAMRGGDGIDGGTLLTWRDPVEMSGTLLLEAAGVTLSPGSSGILAGFFAGAETRAACTAGFQVSAAEGTGAVSVQPIVEGAAAGTSYAIVSSNQYTLRVRTHCAEMERELAIYRSYGDSGEIACGGQTVAAPGRVHLEIQEFAGGVGAMPVTLYDGQIASLPSACFVVAASSINLIGTMRALNLTNLGTGWVVSTPAGGGPRSRPVGTLGEAAQCHVERNGKLVFYAGFAPAAGEQVAVSYRTVGRAVGRSVNAASQAALALAGFPSEAAWTGSVSSPAARSSQDCRNAASAIEQAAAGVGALWSGSYKGTGISIGADVWPGDALLLNAPSACLNAQVVVRTVKVSYRASYPDLVEYAIAFANDWAEDLAIKTSGTVPSDAWLPAPVAPVVLANLTGLSVTALSGSAVTVDAGVTPPVGGGFEIRRRDFAFMAGEDTGLVMRGSQPVMTFSRESVSDRFYIRMYDGATPPNYSEFSTALFINLPLGS
jgi:hypothetical protein